MAQAAVSAGTITCSVVIPTRDRPQELARCLRALEGQSHSPLEIVVVDSAPEHSRAADIATRFGARYVFEPKMGASRARNRGARECSGEVIAYLDDDCEPQIDWLKAIADEFADPRVAVVTGRIRPTETDDATEQQDSIGLLDCGPGYRKVDSETPDWFELVNFGALSGGGNMAIRRSVFERWKGFDERLGRGAPQDGNEEPRAYLEFIDQGYSAVYTPRALVEHPLPAGTELRKRLLRDMRWSAAYLTLLAVEHPQHRRAALRYAWQSLRGRRRAWRAQPSEDRRRIASTPRVMLEWAKGPFLYLRMRWQTRRRTMMYLPKRLAGNWRTARVLRRGGVTWSSLALFPLRRRIGARECRLQLRDGTDLRAPAEEPLLTLFSEAWVSHRYTKSGFQAAPGTTIIDIGANVGVFAVRCARLNPHATVIALEPSAMAAAALRQNIERNGLKNVRVLQVACAGVQGTRTLFRRGPSVLSSLFWRDLLGSEFVPVGEVAAITLSDLFEREHVTRCELLKMDCEGAEYEILLNAPADVLKRINRIALEYHLGMSIHCPGELASFLGQQGFSVLCEPPVDEEGGYLYATRPHEDEDAC